MEMNDKNMRLNDKVLSKEYFRKKTRSLLFIKQLWNQKIKKKYYFRKLDSIPIQKLKGLLYFKMIKMHMNGIHVFLNVQKELTNNEYWYHCYENINDISQILEIYLDSAYQSVYEANPKYIIIDIEVIQKDLVFSVSNTYYGKSENGKYATVFDIGNQFVQNILTKNKYLVQRKEINGIYIVRKVIMKGNA